MRKKRLLKYIIPSLTMILGIIIAVIGISVGAKEDYIKQLNLTDIQAVVDPDGIAGLDINITYTDVDIIASNDVDKIEINANNISRKYLNYSVSGHIFRLKYDFNKWHEMISIPGLVKQAGKIQIIIPADISLQDIQIKTGSGYNKIKYLTAEKIFIDCGLGNNNIECITSDYIEVNNGLGKVLAENISSDKISLSCGAGKADVKNFHSENAEIKVGMGELKLNGIIEGNSSIECGVGNVKAILYGDKNDYAFNIINGNINVNGKDISNNTEGKYNIDVECGIGNIDILFK